MDGQIYHFRIKMDWKLINLISDIDSVGLQLEISNFYPYSVFTALNSISTSMSGCINLLTSTMVAAGG